MLKLSTYKHIYRALNNTVFRGVLTMPVILFTRANHHAQYINVGGNLSRSVIEINPREITGFQHATAIMYHEMIHQLIEEHFELEEDDHHGPLFWKYYKLFVPSLDIELGECL